MPETFQTRTKSLAVASHNASRTVTSPRLLMRPSWSVNVPDCCRLGARPSALQPSEIAQSVGIIDADFERTGRNGTDAGHSH